MRTSLMITTLVLATVLTTPAVAGKKKGGGGGTAMAGTIMNLPDKTVVFDIPKEGKPGERHITYINDSTIITIDGKPGTHRDLAVGMAVSIKGGKIAKSITATSPPKKNW